MGHKKEILEKLDRIIALLEGDEAGKLQVKNLRPPDDEERPPKPPD